MCRGLCSYTKNATHAPARGRLSIWRVYEKPLWCYENLTTPAQTGACIDYFVIHDHDAARAGPKMPDYGNAQYLFQSTPPPPPPGSLSLLHMHMYVSGFHQRVSQDGQVLFSPLHAITCRSRADGSVHALASISGLSRARTRINVQQYLRPG